MSDQEATGRRHWELCPKCGGCGEGLATEQEQRFMQDPTLPIHDCPMCGGVGTVPVVTHTYEMRRDIKDVTYGGMFGGEPDTMRRVAQGPCRYYCDGEQITREQFEAGLLRLAGQ